MQPDIFPTVSLQKVFCNYHLKTQCDDGSLNEDVRVVLIHVHRSRDIMNEFEFHMRMLVKAGQLPRHSKWKLLNYLPECGHPTF